MIPFSQITSGINIYIILFFIIFVLFLFESVYFIKKKSEEVSSEPANVPSPDSAKTEFSYGLLVIILLAILGFLSFKIYQKVSVASSATKKLASLPKSAAVNNQSVVSPTSGAPSQTQNLILLSPTSSPVTISVTPGQSPTPVFTVTPVPSPTLTPKPTVTIVPSPTRIISPSPISVISTAIPPEAINDSAVSPSQAAAVVVPKIPVAGSVKDTVTIFFFAAISLITGFIL